MSDVLYSCVLLNEQSRMKILTKIGGEIPNNFKVICHHMTINLGELEDKSEIGKMVTLEAVSLGISDMAMALKVGGYPSKNDIPHITIAIEEKIGKPVMSNKITNWVDITPFYITGVVTEIKKNGL